MAAKKSKGGKKKKLKMTDLKVTKGGSIKGGRAMDRYNK
jgi:hypothetical protein